MQQSYRTRSGGGGGSGSDSAPQPARVTALEDIMEDAIAYICCFLYLEEVGRLDTAMCSASLRCAFLHSISGDALAALKTEIYSPYSARGVSVLTSELGRWLSLRGMALREYMIDENLEVAPLDIFRNTKRLILYPTKVHHPLVGILLAGTRHTLEELCVGSYTFFTGFRDIGSAFLRVLETLRGLNTKISTFKIHSCFVDSGFDKIARFLAKHFTNLRDLRFTEDRFNNDPTRNADVEVILRACSNLEIFESTHTMHDLDRPSRYHSVGILFESGHLTLARQSSRSLVDAAFLRFGESSTSLTWIFTDANDDDDLVLMTSMRSKLQHFGLRNAKKVTDDGLIRALSSLPHLTSIRLSSCDQLTVAGLQALIESRWPLRYFHVERDCVDAYWKNVDHCEYRNVLKFDEGVITHKGDLYSALAEVFSCRQRDAQEALGHGLPP
jgi:hypothetical protein